MNAPDLPQQLIRDALHERKRPEKCALLLRAAKQIGGALTPASHMELVCLSQDRSEEIRLAAWHLLVPYSPMCQAMQEANSRESWPVESGWETPR
jgi:hypothetical protein